MQQSLKIGKLVGLMKIKDVKIIEPDVYCDYRGDLWTLWKQGDHGLNFNHDKVSRKISLQINQAALVSFKQHAPETYRVCKILSNL